MISRTTASSLTLPQLQKIVEDAERTGFQLVALVAAEFEGVRFNHLSLEDVPTLPNRGPYAVLVPLSPGVSDPRRDPGVSSQLAQGKTLLFVTPVHIAESAVTLAVLR